MPKFTARDIASASLIAALYTTLSLVFMPISFGVYQIRIAEGLTVLPFLIPAAIPGLYIGCLLANILGGMGWLDILIGPLITLAAALLTRFCGDLHRKKHGARTLAKSVWLWLAPLPPVLLNAFGVSAYLAPLIGVSYWFSVQMVGIGQIVACYGIGLTLLLLLRRRKLFPSEAVNVQGSDWVRGYADGERNVHASGGWFLAGFCLGGIGVLIAYIVKPSPSASMFVGESQEYAQAYIERYKSKSASEQGKRAWLGFAVACLVSLFIWVKYYYSP